MDKYRPTNAQKIQMLRTQIEECQTMIYRNDLENLTFIEKNDEDKQTEVKTNNKILSKKIDVLSKELDSLDASSGNIPE